MVELTIGTGLFLFMVTYIYVEIYIMILKAILFKRDKLRQAELSSHTTLVSRSCSYDSVASFKVNLLVNDISLSDPIYASGDDLACGISSNHSSRSLDDMSLPSNCEIQPIIMYSYNDGTEPNSTSKSSTPIERERDPFPEIRETRPMSRSYAQRNTISDISYVSDGVLYERGQEHVRGRTLSSSISNDLFKPRLKGPKDQ